MSTQRDELLNLHGPLTRDAKLQPEYRDNTETAIYGYSEGVEHALDTVWAKGYRPTRPITTAATMTTPTPEAIEAAARTMAEFNHWDWADLADGYQTSWLRCAENMLTAAALVLQGQANADELQAAYEAGFKLGQTEALMEAAETLWPESLDEAVPRTEVDRTARVIAIRLRARAATIEGKDS